MLEPGPGRAGDRYYARKAKIAERMFNMASTTGYAEHPEHAEHVQ